MKKISVNELIKFIIDYDYELSVADNFVCSDMTNLKLQKLIYYTQFHCLLKFRTPLFDEKIVAWMHGPVVEFVYYDLRDCEGTVYGRVLSNSEKYKTPKITKKQSNFLKDVIYYYNRLSPWFLRDLIKTENCGCNPFSKTERGSEISHEAMKSYEDVEVEKLSKRIKKNNS
jgi:uncharacterized phage-associated protein